MKILSKDVSVVVQGPVVGKTMDRIQERWTFLCLKSFRSHFPDSEIILSTWEGEDVDGLVYDKLLLNADPGAIVCHPRLNFYNNVNRQIVSTLEGVRVATRPYVLKVRSDLIFYSNEILEKFDLFTERCQDLHLLNSRVLVCSMFSKNPHSIYPFPFHPSDWVHFGLKEDLLEVWNIPLAPEPDTSRWFENHSRPKKDLFPHLLTRCLPEQYIWTEFLRKSCKVDIGYPWEATEKFCQLSELSIVNNLVIYEPERLGFRSPKYKLKFKDWLAVYSHAEWQHLYKKHCSPMFQPEDSWRPLLKKILMPISVLAPQRLSETILHSLLNRNARLLEFWENNFPLSFRFAQKIFQKLAG